MWHKHKTQSGKNVTFAQARLGQAIPGRPLESHVLRLKLNGQSDSPSPPTSSTCAAAKNHVPQTPGGNNLSINQMHSQERDNSRAMRWIKRCGSNKTERAECRMHLVIVLNKETTTTGGGEIGNRANEFQQPETEEKEHRFETTTCAAGGFPRCLSINSL